MFQQAKKKDLGGFKSDGRIGKMAQPVSPYQVKIRICIQPLVLM